MKRKNWKPEHWQVVAACLMFYDLVALHGAWLLALWARYDFVFSEINQKYIYAYERFITPYAVLCLILFVMAHLYRSMLRFASYRELIKVLGLSLLTSVLHVMGITLLLQKMPITYYLSPYFNSVFIYFVVAYYLTETPM